MSPSTHLQLENSPRNPPTTGPIVGPALGQTNPTIKHLSTRNSPKNGAEAKILMAKPLCCAENISAMTPPAFVKGLEPKAPAKNLKMITLWMF